MAGEHRSRLRGEGRPCSHFAVLYRLNAQSRPLEEALREVGHPLRGARRRPPSSTGPRCATCSPTSRSAPGPRRRRLAGAHRQRARRAASATPRSSGCSDFAQERGLPLLEAAARAPPRCPSCRARRGRADRRAWPPSWSATPSAFRAGRHRARWRAGWWRRSTCYAHARARVKSAEAGQRRVEAIDGDAALAGGLGAAHRPEAHALRLAAPGSPSTARGGGARRRRGRDAHHPPRRQGAGVPGGVPGGRWRRTSSRAPGIQGEARDLEEERRLAYVGITRARERLYLSRAAARARRGKLMPRTPSRFLADLPAGSLRAIRPVQRFGSPRRCRGQGGRRDRRAHGRAWRRSSRNP